MSVLRLFFLLGLCLAATVTADSAPKVTNTQLAALEKLLDESELKEVEPEFIEDTDDDDETRWWNPFSWLMSLLSNQCKCSGKVCDCCFKLAFFGQSACVNAEIEEDEQIHTAFTVGDQTLVDRTFNVERSDEICAQFPIAPLNFLNFCFNQQAEVTDEGVVSYCSNVNFKVGGAVGANLKFKCLQYKDGQLTFEGETELDKSGMLSWQAKDPFTTAVEMVKLASGKK